MVSMVVLGFVMIAEFAARVAEFSKNFNDCFMSFGALIGLILIACYRVSGAYGV